MLSLALLACIRKKEFALAATNLALPASVLLIISVSIAIKISDMYWPQKTTAIFQHASRACFLASLPCRASVLLVSLSIFLDKYYLGCPIGCSLCKNSKYCEACSPGYELSVSTHTCVDACDKDGFRKKENSIECEGRS